MTTIKVNVVDGDIAATSAHALIAAINPGGMWFGGIDGVISRAAGDQFHGQAAAALRADPDVKVVVCKRLSWHYGQFVDVVFVIDDLDEPLYDVIHRGLAAANEVGYRLVSIPAIRFGVMRSIGGTDAEKIDGIARAIRDQEADPANGINELSIVVYGDPDLSAQLRQRLLA